MKINRRVLYWTTAFLVVFITFWLGYFHKSGKKSPAERIVPVEVETVGTGSIEETIELTGWIKANQVVDVASKVGGRVESLRVVLDDEADLAAGDSKGGKERLGAAVEEGVVVRKGQRLAVIDHDVYLAQLAAAEASVQAREVELADAEREEKRIVGLYEGGSATEQNKDKTVTAAQLAVANLSLAKANLKLAQTNLRESMIISPIDGIITAKHIDEGNLVKAGDRIVTVADMKTVKVVVAVAEKYGAKVSVGMPARIKVDAYPERTFGANLYSVHPALDEQTHTIQAEIRIDNDQIFLKPGMFARVTLITRRKDEVVVISGDVILGGKIDRHYVYVAKDGVASKRFVEVGISQADRVEIIDGLKAGESLVVNGMNYLTNGIGIEVVRIEDIGVSKK